MPVTYVIDSEERLIRTRCIGDVKINEVIGHFRTLKHDPNCPNRLEVFLDVSETTSLPFTREITFVAQEINRLRKKSTVQFLRRRGQRRRALWHDANVRGIC